MGSRAGSVTRRVLTHGVGRVGTPPTHAHVHTHTCVHTYKSKARRGADSSAHRPHTRPQALCWASGWEEKCSLTEGLGRTGEDLEAPGGEALPSPNLTCASLPNQEAAPRGLHSSTTTRAPGSCMSPQVSGPLYHLSVKHQAPGVAYSRCSVYEG